MTTMTTPTTAAIIILLELSQRGIRIAIKGEHLSLQPSSNLSSWLKEVIRQFKPELMALLAGGNIQKKAVDPASRTSRQPIPTPRPATILKYCRCVDCRHWVETYIKTYRCRELIPTCGPADQWHWCTCYSGPQISKDVYVWKYDRTGQGVAHRPLFHARIAAIAGDLDDEAAGQLAYQEILSELVYERTTR